MVDPARVRSILGRIADRRDDLRAYAEMPTDEYVSDDRTVAASKYLLLTVIEDVLSLANHVIASEGWESPASYADAFRILTDRDVIDDELAERLAAMARLRNLLVHRYAAVDDARVHHHLRGGREDLAAFAGSVLEAFPGLEAEIE